MCVLLYVLVSHACRAASATYISALAFVAGILWGGFPACCAAVMQKRRLALAICSLAFLVLLAVSLLVENRHLRYMSRALSAPVFAVGMAVLLSMMQEKRDGLWSNGVTAWLGKCSLEIYVSQGLFFQLLRSNLLYVHNAYLYMGAVIVCTMLSAPLLYGLVRGVYAVCAKWLPSYESSDGGGL
jgi:peptidoglycan/LPS O-acetylase OafA/YrhL